jgi:hypothetical protein
VARVNRPRSLWYALCAAFLSALVGSVAAIQYADHTRRESERKWCSVVTTLDDAYHSTPPQTPIGRKIAADLARLRRDLGC